MHAIYMLCTYTYKQYLTMYHILLICMCIHISYAYTFDYDIYMYAMYICCLYVYITFDIYLHTSAIFT